MDLDVFSGLRRRHLPGGGRDPGPGVALRPALRILEQLEAAAAAGPYDPADADHCKIKTKKV